MTIVMTIFGHKLDVFTGMQFTSQEVVSCASLHFIYKYLCKPFLKCQYLTLLIAQDLILPPPLLLTKMKLIVWIGFFATAALGKHTITMGKVGFIHNHRGLALLYVL